MDVSSGNFLLEGASIDLSDDIEQSLLTAWHKHYCAAPLGMAVCCKPSSFVSPRCTGQPQPCAAQAALFCIVCYTH